MRFILDFFARRRLRGKKSSIRRLFFERAENFMAMTIKISERIPHALEAIIELIEEKEIFKSGVILEWSEISLVRAESEDAAIVIIGSVSFPPGAIVELETGEKVTVTLDTAQYFPPRLVRIGIPLKLAEASKDEIKEYIKKTEEEEKKESGEFVKHLQEALEDETEVPVKKIKKQDTIDIDDGFDLTQLTEEQRKQLQLSQKTGNG